MTITIHTGQFIKAMSTSIRAGAVPMFWGSPGIGKSALAAAFAKEYNLFLIDLRLANSDPVDLVGFPNVNKATQRAGYLPFDTFPLENDPIPEGYDGWLLFLDELPLADRPVQKGAYKLIYDRMVGQAKLHPRLMMAAAGNLITDNAFVEDMSTAMQSRLTHYEVTMDNNTWVEWAEANGIHHWITSFIKTFPQMLFTFKPDHPDRTFGSGRTWESASKHLHILGIDDDLTLAALAGTISEGIAREFIGYTKIYADLPQMVQILGQPHTTPVPQEPGTVYALTGTLAHQATVANIDRMIVYIRRLPKEFQVITMREMLARNPELKSTPAVIKWRSDFASAVY